MQLVAVFLRARPGGREDGVELADGSERVDVRRVTVVILVLHETGERFELRHEAAEHAQFMHQRQRRVDAAGLLQHGTEAQVGVERLDHALVDELERRADEGGEVDIRCAVELLAMPEDANEPHRVVLEDVRVLGGELAAAQQEAVEPLRALGAADHQQVFQRADEARPRGDGQREALLDDFRKGVNRRRMPVVIVHERLDALQQRRLRVAEVGREPRLHLEVEHVGGVLAHVVQLVPHPEQEMVAALERAQLGRLQVVLFDQFLQPRDAEPHPRHPERVLVVAQAADAVLDVGLLHEDGVAILPPAAGLVVEARGDVAFRVVREVVLAVGLGKILVERLRPGDEPRFQQRGLGADVAAGFGEDLVERAGGVADLQAEVPERIEDAVGEVFLELRQRLHVGGRGEEEHHVDVAQRAELAAAVAAEGDEADGRGRLAVLLAPTLDGRVEERPEQPVHHRREGLDNFLARFAVQVPLADARTFG